MTPTIEEVKRVALDGSAFVAIECVTYSLQNGEIVFTKEQLHSFSTRMIEIGRKEQQEKDSLICKRLSEEPSDSMSDYADGFDAGCRECANAIRNNTGE